MTDYKKLFIPSVLLKDWRRQTMNVDGVAAKRFGQTNRPLICILNLPLSRAMRTSPLTLRLPSALTKLLARQENASDHEDREGGRCDGSA